MSAAPEPEPVICRCGKPITRCLECARDGEDLYKGYIHKADLHALGSHYCADGISLAEPAPRADGSQPDPDPHHCAVCGNTIGLRMLGDKHYCEDLDACYGRRHEGEPPWGGVL